MKNNAGTAFYQLRPYPAFQRGLEEGGPILVHGAMVLGANGSSVSAAPHNPEADEDLALEQENLLKKWAIDNNCWYPNANLEYSSRGYKFYGYGGEAQVYTEEDTFVHKVCRIGQYCTPERFFERIIIQNAMCPAAALFVEGLGNNSAGEFVVMLKQTFFRQAHIMSEDEISLYMNCIGFRKVVDERYGTVRFISNLIIAEDLHQGNIWMTNNDNVVIVDGAFFFNYQVLCLGGII